MFKKILYFFDIRQKRSLIILFTFMLIATGLEMIGLGFIFSIIGALSPENTNNSLFLKNLSDFFELSAEEVLVYLLSVFLVFYIIKTTLLMYYSWFEANFLYFFKETLSSKVFKEYLNQSYSYFYNRNSSEFLRNLITEIDQFHIYLISILKIALEIFVVVGIVGILAYINLYFTFLIIIIILFFSFLYFYLIKEKLNRWGHLRLSSIQKRIQFMQEGFDGIKIIKLMGRENFFFSKFKTHNIILSKVSQRSYFFQNVPKLLFELLGIFFITLSLFLFNYYGKNLAEITQILSVYVAASFRVFPSANRLVSSLQLIKLSAPGVNTLYDELRSFKKDTQQSFKKFDFNKNISIDLKKFKYPNSNNFEISNVKFNISKGQKIGIIGPSASGKSTVVEILSGILKPEKGDVVVDGISIFSDIKAWQKLIGFVPQKILILDESLRNNILFGLDNKKYTNDQIVSLLKKLSLDKLLERLDKGLDGNLGEKGINLSGGEIQRIGLCRALIYDPEIILLDEATSSLDINTESQILDELKIFREKTIISIAHRINTLKNCDMIYNFDNGKIIDQGNFNKFKIKN